MFLPRWEELYRTTNKIIFAEIAARSTARSLQAAGRWISPGTMYSQQSWDSANL